jgi:hypothetical protein
MKNVAGMNIKMMIILALVALMADARPAAAQADSCLERTVTVGVLTDHGDPVVNLTRESFAASQHKKTVQIRSAAPNSLAPRVVILLDASYSATAAAGDWQRHLGIASSIVKDLSPGSQIGLVVFAGKIDTYIALSNDRSKIQEELRMLQRGPRVSVLGTALWDSVSKVVATEFKAPREGDAIYAITDGDDTASLTKVNDVSKNLISNHTRLFAFVDRSDESGLIVGGESLSNLLKIISATGGYAIIFARNSQQMPPLPAGAFQKPSEQEHLLALQLKQISNYYSLGIELPEGIKKDQGWQLKSLESGPRKVLVTYPQVLAACPSPNSP